MTQKNRNPWIIKKEKKTNYKTKKNKSRKSGRGNPNWVVEKKKQKKTGGKKRAGKNGRRKKKREEIK